jgi:hypothetical protein
MYTIDRFISQLDKLSASLQSGKTSRTLDGVERDFAALVAPVIGIRPAEDLAGRMLERINPTTAGSLQKIGYVAAFFLGEYDEASMPLEAEDWQEIKDTIEDTSEEIDITTLTSLMNGLLSCGLL